MLRVNVGLSKKLSKDFNSNGYSINIEGEITAPISDPERLTEEVKQLYDLAEEALALQVERSQSETAIAGRDEPPARPQLTNGNGRPTNGDQNRERRTNGAGTTTSSDAASNKQLQYLLSLGKRQRLSTVELEHRIAEVLGQQINLYDLTKKQAAVVIDDLAGENGKTQSQGRRQ